MKRILPLLALSAVIFTGCGATPSKDKSMASLSCSAGMSEYKLANSPLQFCYDKAWGEPIITAVSAKTGAAQSVSFGAADNAKAPMIWIETNDSATPDGNKSVKFEFLNAMNENESQLKTQIKTATGYEEKDLRARKGDVGGVRAIRAEVAGKINKIIYFVPSAYENHHMMVSGSLDMAEVIDEFVFDMAL